MTDNTRNTWRIAGTYQGRPITLHAHAAKCAHNNRLAILLYTDDTDAELFADLSINVPQVHLDADKSQIIVDHNTSSDVLAMAISSGLLNDAPDFAVSYGMANSHVYSLTRQAAQWARESTEDNADNA